MLINTYISVTCRCCKHFIHCTPPCADNALGLCGEMAAWELKVKNSGKVLTDFEFNEAYKKIGSKLCWPDVDRYCVKFQKL